MNQRRRTAPGVLQLALVGAALLALASGAAPVHAQQITTLIQFTNLWKYDQSGQELGTTWRTNDYDDSAWPSGRGLLGFEDNLPPYAVHAPLLTPLTISSTVTTFYFRTTFILTGLTDGLSLVASNLVDDGCALYLNGLRVGSVRAPAFYNANTFFPGGTEGQLEAVTFTNLSALRPGENRLAAEVHQSANTSADIMWGLRLMAMQETPLDITHQPQSQAVTVGDPVTLSVGVSGGPAFYRWEKDGVIQSSTSNTLTIASAHPANADNYRVIVTNSISAVTSSVATLTVISDTTGPRLLAAIADNRSPSGGSSFGSNTINVQFSEPLLVTTSRGTNNYILKRLGTTNTVPILSILYSTALGALLLVDPADPDWIYGGDYTVTVNNVRDDFGNVIAPDSQIAVSWPQTRNVTQFSDAWRFHNSSIFDPDPVETNWYACDFVESFWWADGRGPFCGGVFTPFPPSSTCVGCATQLGFQPEPALFRTWFDWPANLPTVNTVLRPRFAVDDGAVFYVNGVEIYRYHMPGGPIISTTKAVIHVPTPVCITNVSWPVTNLVSGSNCLAVAVFQGRSSSDADTVFALEFDINYLLRPNLPPEPEPMLAVTPLGPTQLRLAWQGHGYALESATNLALGSASYPVGPWQQLTNMSNPYTNNLTDPVRFFRLKK